MFTALKHEGKSNRLILWPRGHFKTSAVVVDIVQTILNDPDCRLLLMQATLKLTKGWLHEVYSHFNGRNPKSKLLQLFPDFKATGSADNFTVAARKRVHLKEATCTVASPKAITTGQHYGAMFADDLVHAVNFRNVELMDKLESEFNHFLPLIDPGGYVTVTGTRYSFADIYARIIKRESTKENSNWVISVRECFKADGSLLFPERKIADGRNIGFTAELLAELQRNDPEMFGPQYLNKILAGKDQIFPTDILLGAVKSSKDAEFPATAPCIMMIDLAESTKAGADHSVVVIAKQDRQGRVWIVDCVGHTWTPAQTANVILTLMLQHRPYKILVEKQPGAEFFAEFLKATGREKGLNVPIDFIKGGRQKDAKYIRIAALENAFKNKRLFLCAGIKDFERLEEEFTQFPRGRHDDRPDCIALIVGHLSQNTFVELQPIGVRSPMSFLYPKGWDEPVDTTPSRNMCGDGFVG